MKASDWIPFSKQFPEEGQKCVLLHKSGRVGDWTCKRRDTVPYPEMDYTHWMPFTPPEPDDGFEEWWASLPRDLHHPYRQLSNDIYAPRDAAHLIWKAAQAAVKGGKV